MEEIRINALVKVSAKLIGLETQKKMVMNYADMGADSIQMMLDSINREIEVYEYIYEAIG